MYSDVYGLLSVSDRTRSESRSFLRCGKFLASSATGCALWASLGNSNGRFLSARAVAASASMFASCRRLVHDGS